MLPYLLVKSNDPVLTAGTELFVGELTSLNYAIKAMISTMNYHGGIGLAAPQVGMNLRLFVMEAKGRIMVCINPEILTYGPRTMPVSEGCLSFPGESVDTERADHITVSYIDQHGNRQTTELDGIDAVCFQHELDHLNGVTFHERAK